MRYGSGEEESSSENKGSTEEKTWGQELAFLEGCVAVTSLHM